MKVEVKPGFCGPCVKLTQGNQSFTLSYSGTETECKWYARMFRIALKKHDEELAKKRNGVL